MGYTFGPKRFPRGSKVLGEFRANIEDTMVGKSPTGDTTLLDTVAAIVFPAYLFSAYVGNG